MRLFLALLLATSTALAEPAHDKQMHALGSYAVNMTLYRLLFRGYPLISAATTLAIGALKEVVIDKEPEVTDMAANTIGVAVSTLILTIRF